MASPNPSHDEYSATASETPKCHFCEDMELRNISAHSLKERNLWRAELISGDAIESLLNMEDARQETKTFAHRKSRRDIFHSTSVPQPARQGPTICDFCRHLNLKHLFSRLHDYVVEITMGTVDALRARSKCSFCRLITESVMASSGTDGDQDTAGPSKIVRMRFAYTEAEALDDQGVKVYVGISEIPLDIMLRVFTAESSISIQTELRAGNCAAANQNRRLVSAFVDWDRLRSPISRCRWTHPDCGNDPRRSFPKDFRLIDVDDRRVVRYRTDEVPPYFALSYTWGQNPDDNYLAISSTIPRFESLGSLGNEASELPKVIEDAIKVCHSLDMRYLWVDRLCIVQDDAVHKLQQINAMDTIFGAAQLVIVAASARNMNEGLAGVSQERREQPMLELDDFTVVSSLSRFAGVMHQAPWQKRGWTYQEAALGRRKLYFTSTQAFFDCGNGRLVTAEDDFAEGSTFGISIRRAGSETISEYYRHIDQYNRRSLSYSSDTYKAIQGVMSRLYAERAVYFGLPAADFDQALLWRAHDGLQHRRSSPDVMLPGWSWSCTKSGIQRWQHLFLGTVVSWRICVEHPTEGSPILKCIIADHPPETWLAWKPEFACQTLCPQLSMALAWKDCIETEGPFQDARSTMLTLSDLHEKLQDSWPTYKDFWNAAFERSPSSSSDIPPNISFALKPGMLIGRVQLKHFPIHLHDQVRAKDCTDCIHKSKLHIECSSDARPAGILEQPHPGLDWIRARSSTLYFAALSISEWQPSETCFDWMMPNDLPRMSLRTGHDLVNFPAKDLWDTRAKLFQQQTGQHSIPGDDKAIWSFQKENLPSERPPLLVNLMLLDVHGDVARCVCKGWMFLRIWSRQPCDFTTIGLDPEQLDY